MVFSCESQMFFASCIVSVEPPRTNRPTFRSSRIEFSIACRMKPLWVLKPGSSIVSKAVTTCRLTAPSGVQPATFGPMSRVPLLPSAFRMGYVNILRRLLKIAASHFALHVDANVKSTFGCVLRSKLNFPEKLKSWMVSTLISGGIKLVHVLHSASPKIACFFTSSVTNGAPSRRNLAMPSAGSTATSTFANVMGFKARRKFSIFSSPIRKT